MNDYAYVSLKIKADRPRKSNYGLKHIQVYVKYSYYCRERDHHCMDEDSMINVEGENLEPERARQHHTMFNVNVFVI